MAKIKNLIINFTLALLSLVILLFLLEGSLRVVVAFKRSFWGSDWLSFCPNPYFINQALFKKNSSPDFPNIMPPNIETSIAGRRVRTNSFGMRAETDYSLLTSANQFSYPPPLFSSEQ